MRFKQTTVKLQYNYFVSTVKFFKYGFSLQNKQQQNLRYTLLWNKLG